MLLNLGLGMTSLPVLQRHGGGTPTPTPSIGTPVITQTSTPTTQPFAWTVAEDATWNAGDYWHVQRTAGGSFPFVSNNIVINGDSWDVDYIGYYAGYWKSLNGALSISNIATGGRSIGLIGTTTANTLTYTEGQVIALRPQIYFAGSGANDLGNYASGAAWAAAMKAHLQRIKDAVPGVLLVTRTPCAAQIPASPSYNAQHNANRPAAVAAMRQWLTDGFLGALADFAGNSSIGDDADMIPAAASSTTISVDGQHLYDRQNASSGHDIASPIFATAMNAAVALMPLLNGEAVQQIAQGDLVDNATIIFPDLPSAPSGPLALRLRVGQENGAGGYVWSGWSNVLTDTISAGSTAVLVSASGVNKSQYIDVSGSPKLTAAMNNNLGAPCSVRSTQTATGKCHWEVTLNSFSTQTNNLVIGLADSSLVIGPAVFPRPGAASTSGISINIKHASPTVDVYANGGVSGTPSLIGVPAAGDLIIVEFDTTANTVSMWHSRAGTHLLLFTKTLISGIPTNWSAQVGGNASVGGPDSVTVNFGATTFAKTPSTGYGIYG